MSAPSTQMFSLACSRALSGRPRALVGQNQGKPPFTCFNLCWTLCFVLCTMLCKCCSDLSWGMQSFLVKMVIKQVCFFVGSSHCSRRSSHTFRAQTFTNMHRGQHLHISAAIEAHLWEDARIRSCWCNCRGMLYQGFAQKGFADLTLRCLQIGQAICQITVCRQCSRFSPSACRLSMAPITSPAVQSHLAEIAASMSPTVGTLSQKC